MKDHVMLKMKIYFYYYSKCSLKAIGDYQKTYQM